MPRTSTTLSPSKTPRNWQGPFLAALGETSNVAAAARAAGVALSVVYRLRRTSPDFKSRWLAALCEGYDNLEMDLLCWLRSGKVESPSDHAEPADAPADEPKPDSTVKTAKARKSSQSQAPTPPPRKFDAAVALRVLAAHRDAVGQEKGRQALADEGSLIAAIDRKIDAMQARERAARRAARKRRMAARPLPQRVSRTRRASRAA